MVVAEADRRTVQYGLQMPHFASRNIQHPLKPPPFPHFFLKILAHPNKCLTFAAPEPAKPLNDAQMSGSFFYMHMTERIPFGKHYTEEQNLITLLQSRGLSITDVNKANHYLTHIGYYRLSAYMYPLLRVPKERLSRKSVGIIRL